MVLLDNIIQVLALPDLDTLVFISVVLFDGRGIGATFVDVDEAGFSAGGNGFVQKSSCCLFISLSC